MLQHQAIKKARSLFGKGEKITLSISHYPVRENIYRSQLRTVNVARHYQGDWRITESLRYAWAVKSNEGHYVALRRESNFVSLLAENQPSYRAELTSKLGATLCANVSGLYVLRDLIGVARVAYPTMTFSIVDTLREDAPYNV